MKKLSFKNASVLFVFLAAFVSISFSALNINAGYVESFSYSNETSDEYDEPFWDIPSTIIISDEEYKWIDGKEYISVPLGKTVEEVLDVVEFTPDGYKDVKNSSGVPLGLSEKVATGCTVNLIKQGSDSAYIVVLGDVSGDGKIDSTDYLKIKSHLIGTNTLEWAYKKAADFDSNGEIGSTDFLKIKNYFISSSAVTE